MLGAVRASRVGGGVRGEDVPVQVIQADRRIPAQARYERVARRLVAGRLGVLAAVRGPAVSQREDFVQMVNQLADGRRGEAAGAVVVLDHGRNPFGVKVSGDQVTCPAAARAVQPAPVRM